MQSCFQSRAIENLEQKGIFFAITQHLLDIIQRVLNLHIYDLSVLENRSVDRIDETGVGRQVQLAIAVKESTRINKRLMFI